MTTAGEKIQEMLARAAEGPRKPRPVPKCATCIRAARRAWTERRDVLVPRDCHAYMTPEGRGPYYTANCLAHEDAELDARVAAEIAAAVALGEKGRATVERLERLQGTIARVRAKRGSVVAGALEPEQREWFERDD